MKLSIIIISWNVKEKLRENLKSIYASLVDFSFEVVVVDNNSADESAEMVAKDFPQVKLIRNSQNLGFAKANNQAMRELKSEFVLLLNPDMKLLPDTLRNMIGWMMTNENAWIAGCHLLGNNDETIRHVRRFPTLWDQSLIVLKIPHLFPSVLDGYLRAEFDYAKAAKVDSVRGGFFMLNMKNFRSLPLLDERYFLWFEEVDLCQQVNRLGGEVWYTRDARCVDLVGQSFGQVQRFQTQKYFRDSMLKYFLKWHGFIAYSILYILWLPMLGVASFVDIFKIRSKAKT